MTSRLILLAVAHVALCCRGQGTLQVTFDAWPWQPPRTAYTVQDYWESGMRFWSPTGDGFTRVGSGSTGIRPDNGTSYLAGAFPFSLTFNPSDNSLFGIASVELAAYSTGVPDFNAKFVGYRPDGSTVTADFSGSGINFQTFYFDSEFSGLSRVEVPYFGSLDNLVVSVPEPSVPLWITDITRANNHARLTWSGGSGRYQLLRTTNLASGVWENVGYPTSETSATVAATNAVEFFRVQSLPQP